MCVYNVCSTVVCTVMYVCPHVQGTARAECTLYYWNYYDKIVVSDVDGTITMYIALSSQFIVHVL